MTPMIPCTNQVMAQMDARHRRIIAVIMPPRIPPPVTRGGQMPPIGKALVVGCKM